MYRSWLAALALLALFAGPIGGNALDGASPPGEPPVRTFSMAEYKSNVQNWGAALGPDGLIYVGGGMGLLEYDGVRWTRHDTPNNSRVRVMHIQPRDEAPARIWIGSSNQFGYFQRDATGAMVYRSISDQLPEPEREFGDIRDLVEVDGVLYFAALRTLFRWDGQELRQKPEWDGVFRWMTATDGRVLVVVRQRLHDVTGLDWPHDEPPPPLDRWRWDALGDRGRRMTFLEPWHDGRMLYGTYDQGLFWLSEVGTEPEPFDVAPGTGIDVTTAWPYIVHRRDDGTLLLATRHIGLLHLAADGTLIEHIGSDNGLPMDVINGLAEDGQGGVWLSQQGVITRVGLDDPIRTWGEAAGLTQARGMAVHDGRIVLGVASGVVRLEAADTDASRVVPLESPMIETWHLLSADGELFGAGSEGVHRLTYDAETDELIETERLLADHYAYRLRRSHDRPVIYAELESGLGLIVKQDGRWVDGGSVEGIDERVDHTAEAPDGRVWVGSVQGRFYVMQWEGDELKVVNVLGRDEGVPEGYAWPFVVGDEDGHDNRRRLVLGTFDGGYRPVLDDAGLPIGVEPDPLFGNEALGDDRRIFRVASPDGKRVLAGIGDGGALRFGWIGDNGAFDWQPHPVPGIAVGQNDFIRSDADGAWIGRNPGLVRLAWPEREGGGAAAPLSVTRAGYPGQDNWLRGGPGGAANLSDAVPNQRLPFQKGSLRFEYALAEFAEPDKHRYRVQLEGLEDAWSNWTEETRRDYTNLPGGDYVFKVQARDARGRVSESAPLSFSVAPPWYLGAPMLAVYAATALLLLWIAAVLGRARKERQWAARRQELETEVADRTREVRRQAREIREMSDARAAFFANVSHELRTPLTLTRAPLEELARDIVQFNPEQRQHLDMALRNTEAMQSLIGQVLDLHRLDAERMPFHPARADLCAAVTSTVQRFDVHAKSKGIELVVEGAEQAIQAAFDAEHLATIVSNLVSNACKFAPRGTTVTVRLAEQGGGHLIEVTDAGPGVPDKDRDRIFQRYQQADNAPQGGTGIGLALVRELVELHEGRVEIDDAPGGGARFRVRLPDRPELPTAGARPDAEPAEAPEPGVEIAEDASNGDGNDDRNGNGDRPTVLIVDDNAELRGFLRLRLGRAYRIVEAGDGRQGLEKARETIPDAIVTDGMMPELDGLGLTRELKADPETDFIPVLMLTARGGADAVVRGMQAGADDYLAKPFDTAELAARIAGLIASRRRLRERLVAMPPTEPEPAEDPFIAKARSIAAEQLGEPGFSVRDWAALLHMDRTTLFRKFKVTLGRSPDEDLREMRLQRAAALLRERAGNVAEVADAVGFASVSAFSRRFRERFEESPAAYARKGYEG